MVSTDKIPKHENCPPGEDSWCRHCRAEAKNEPSPKHKPTFKAEILPIIFPLIKRICEPELLQRCSYRSKMGIETAVALATLSFNCGPSGITRVMEKLSIPVTASLSKHVRRLSLEIVKRAKSKAKGISKWKRRSMKLKRRTLEAECMEKEGVTYEASVFNLPSTSSQ